MEKEWHRPRKFQGQHWSVKQNLWGSPSHLMSSGMGRGVGRSWNMAVSHTGSLQNQKKTMPPFRGNPHQKFTIHICIKFGFPPKKWVIFHDPELHIPPSSKKIHIPPNLEEIESFPEKKKHGQSKSYNLEVQQSSWLVLGNRTLWWHHQRKAFHLNMPHVETYPTRRLQITKLSARFNKGAHHLCFFTLHKLRTWL